MATLDTPARPDLSSVEQRTVLARLIMQLFEHWQLSAADQANLLGLSEGTRSTLSRYRKGAMPLPPAPDLLARVGHLLGIHQALRAIFPHNRDLAYRWIVTPNRCLDGQPPLAIMREHGLLGMVAVRRYLEFERER
jgi:hypothetical protein